jgi:diaminopimelate epimerase
MIKLRFSKYQGTGNDFIMIDNRDMVIDSSNFGIIKKLCNRKFGIGSDGLILIENHEKYDFEMIYFNPDGSQSLCGNGSRCAVRFASLLDIIEKETTFHTIEGPLYAYIENDMVHLKMPDVNGFITTENKDLFINTGSPHYIKFVNNIQNIDVYHYGKEIRDSIEFQPDGTNVNFVQWEDPNHITVRTFERGVENETLSCGTGVTASALATGIGLESGEIEISTPGGKLTVKFEQPEKGKFNNIFLIGPAEKVFDGTIEI